MRASNTSMKRSILAGLACVLAATTACGGKGNAATGSGGTTTTAVAGTSAASSSTTSPSSTSTTTTTGRSTTTTTTPPTTVPPAPPPGSGVYGAVTASPTCPVERVDQPCPPEPLSVQLDANDPGGHTVATTHADSAGHYRLSLAPGSYILVAQTTGMYPRCPATPVTVPAGSAVRQDINCDTGIR